MVKASNLQPKGREFESQWVQGFFWKYWIEKAPPKREKLVILTFDFFTGIRKVEKILSDPKCAKRNPEDD